MPATPVTQPEPPARFESEPVRVVRRWTLAAAGELIRLDTGVTRIGRSRCCEIAIDSDLVSRLHARVTVSSTGVTVEDLKSMNGVTVNGERIAGLRSLEEGDVIRIGGVELALRAEHRISSAVPRIGRPLAPVRTGTPAPSMRPGRRTDAFNELARLSDRMISMGRPEMATRLVAERLRSLVDSLRAGQPVSVRMLDSATVQALRIGLANGAASWVDLAIELNLLAKRPMNDDGIELLERALERLPEVDAAIFFYYQQMLHAELEQFGPFARARAERMLGMRAGD
jgi:hypothetical protein